MCNYRQRYTIAPVSLEMAQQVWDAVKEQPLAYLVDRRKVAAKVGCCTATVTMALKALEEVGGVHRIHHARLAVIDATRKERS